MSNPATTAPAAREMPGWLFGFFMGISLTSAVVLVGLAIGHA